MTGKALLALAGAARSLLTDAVTAEVLDRFRRDEVSALVLKGPSFAHWLYEEPSERSYLDTDLLVPPDQRRAAESVLRNLGLHKITRGIDDADMWMRESDGALVDLHRRLPGTHAGEQEVWKQLVADAVEIPLARGRARVPGAVATAMHAALHALQHDGESERPRNDLRQALGRFDTSLWREAAALAARLEATKSFASGLRLEARGSQIADELGLQLERPVEAALRAAGAPPQAVGLYRISAASGAAQKARIATRYLLPSRMYMRVVWPGLARRGPAGLAAAYTFRLVRGALAVPRAIAALRRARVG